MSASATWAVRWKCAAKDARVRARSFARIAVRQTRLRVDAGRCLDEHIAAMPLDYEAVDRVTSNLDAWLRLAGIIDAEMFARLLDGHLNIMVVLEHEFDRRFPNECAAWRSKQDG